MRLFLVASSLVLAACASTPTSANSIASRDPGAGEAEFRALYKELVETNTTFSEGSCTLASERTSEVMGMDFTREDQMGFGGKVHEQNWTYSCKN